MSAFDKTLWRCDGCGLGIELGIGEQPKQWAGVDLFVPPKSSEALSTRKHYCGECISRIQDAMYEKREATA